MSKNSLNAHYQVGEEWREWMKAGGHYKSLKKGKEQLNEWRGIKKNRKK